jgi:hypothetical protein
LLPICPYVRGKALAAGPSRKNRRLVPQITNEGT